MLVQPGTSGKETIVYVWLSKDESEDIVISELIAEIRKKFQVCLYHSGSDSTRDIVRKMIMEKL